MLDSEILRESLNSSYFIFNGLINSSKSITPTVVGSREIVSIIIFTKLKANPLSSDMVSAVCTIVARTLAFRGAQAPDCHYKRFFAPNMPYQASKTKKGSICLLRRYVR